ncbi:hypothetical protein R1flu_017171 [Riccia fluitans]|uniref:Uncharacterized protein n=1 Tax=Riccia fluitans TaxID=41844 RepID=A0ABD1XIE3_9MARC
MGLSEARQPSFDGGIGQTYPTPTASDDTRLKDRDRHQHLLLRNQPMTKSNSVSSEATVVDGKLTAEIALPEDSRNPTLNPVSVTTAFLSVKETLATMKGLILVTRALPEGLLPVVILYINNMVAENIRYQCRSSSIRHGVPCSS